MAAHRRRAPYNMGGAIDPVCDPRNRDCYCQLQVDDTVWLALVPEDSLFLGLRLKIPYADAAGLVINVLANQINLDDGSVIAPIALAGGFAAVVTSAAFALEETLATPFYTNPYTGGVRNGVLVGVQVDALPAGGFCDFQGRIELTVRALDFETAQVADCRINGSCIIENP